MADDTERMITVQTTLAKAQGAPCREHTFVMDITPAGAGSCVLLDGEDISGMLAGVDIRSRVGEATEVALHVVHGQRAQVMVKVPEARIVVHDVDGVTLKELEQLCRHNGWRSGRLVDFIADTFGKLA